LHRPADAQEFRAALPDLASFNGEYRPESAGNIFGHAWTLGIEEKFYLVWPLLMLLFVKDLRRAGLAAIVAAVVLMLAFEVRGEILRGYIGLGFGTAAALWATSSPKVDAASKKAWVAPLAFLGMAFAYAGKVAIPHPFAWNIAISIFATPLIVSIWNRPDQPISRYLSFRPLAWLGRLTYSIYLIHVLVINVVLVVMAKAHLPQHTLAIFAIAYAASIAAAWLPHISVEKPLISVGRRLARAYRSSRGRPITP
jgi:peptidoglycan/LPS O-acetylase OafA/YrhL